MCNWAEGFTYIGGVRNISVSGEEDSSDTVCIGSVSIWAFSCVHVAGIC